MHYDLGLVSLALKPDLGLAFLDLGLDLRLVFLYLGLDSGLVILPPQRSLGYIPLRVSVRSSVLPSVRVSWYVRHAHFCLAFLDLGLTKQ